MRPNIRYAVGDVRPPGFARIFVYAAIHCTQKAVGFARPNTIAWLCGLAGVTKSALPGSVPTSVGETLKMLHEIKTQTPEFWCSGGFGQTRPRTGHETVHGSRACRMTSSTHTPFAHFLPPAPYKIPSGYNECGAWRRLSARAKDIATRARLFLYKCGS